MMVIPYLGNSQPFQSQSSKIGGVPSRLVFSNQRAGVKIIVTLLCAEMKSHSSYFGSMYLFIIEAALHDGR